MKIFVVGHKNFNIKEQFNSALYKKIYVGTKADQLKTINDFSDNVGDNIADKNSSYCELTAIYWIWKNCTEDIVGIFHYRRFLMANNNSVKPITEEYIKKLLSNYDLIVPEKEKFYLRKDFRFDTVYSQYQKCHEIKPLIVAREVLENNYPDYLESFDKIMNQHSYFGRNMMICNKSTFDQYCEWLFDVLAMVEEKIDYTQYDAYNQRVFGFLSERLFNVWIKKNKRKTKSLKVSTIDRSKY